MVRDLVMVMKPKIETINNETIVCLGDYNCVKWTKGKEKQALSLINAGCDEAKEILKQLGYSADAIKELTKDLCGCPKVDPRLCKNPEFAEFITTWKPLYIPYRRYGTLPNKAKELIKKLMERGFMQVLTCCVQYDKECKCVKDDRGYFVTASVVDYDECIEYSRNECVMTVRQALHEILKYV